MSVEASYSLLLSRVLSVEFQVGALLFLVYPSIALMHSKTRLFKASTTSQLVVNAASASPVDFDEDRIVKHAINWCGIHSLLYSDGYNNFTHAPVTLVPNTISRPQFEFAEEVQPIFNELVDKMARDRGFIVSNLQGVAKVDYFTSRLLGILATVSDKVLLNCVNLGVHRSDYMLNGNDDGSETLLQIEINTISSSFGCLSNRVGDLHRFLLQRNADSPKMIDYMRASSPEFSGDLLQAAESIPENPTYRCVALGISIAHILYGDNSAVVIFVVQPNEKNVADQRILESELFRVHGIKVEFLTLAEVAERCSIEGRDTLTVRTENSGNSSPCSVVYFRSGYSPDDYPSEVQWRARQMMESSSAIKCPSVAYQLVGTKKIQQALCVPGVLEKFLSGDKVDKLRKCFAAQYSLGSMQTAEGAAAVEAAIAGGGEKWVLKPQREGGGNNYYGRELASFLERHRGSDVLSGYVLMQRIFPRSQTAVCLKKGKVSTISSISELGIYGVFLGDGSEDVAPMFNQYAGYLLRTKPAGVDEGGVATGFSVLNSVVLTGTGRAPPATAEEEEEEE